MSEEDIRKDKRTEVINEITNIEANKIWISDIKNCYSVLIDYNDTIFKKDVLNVFKYLFQTLKIWLR